MTQPIFRWETLQVVGRHVLRFKEEIHGTKMEVELVSGNRILVFRADDGLSYFCHGLTFGGEDAPGGAISPYSGAAVRTILNDLYAVVTPESAGVAGDVVVWIDADESPFHSAILVSPTVKPNTDRLDYGSVLRSKNGRLPEAEMTLESLAAGKESYGESYRVYRRR